MRCRQNVRVLNMDMALYAYIEYSSMTKVFLSFFLFISFTQRVQASETAFAVMLKYGFKAADLVSVLKKYPELKNFELASGIDYSFPEERIETEAKIKLYAKNGNEAYILSKSPSGVNVEKIDVQYEIETRSFQGIFRHSLYDSILADIGVPTVALEVSETFKDEFPSAKGLKVETLYRFQVEQYLDNGRFVKYANVLSASLIIGEAIIQKTLQLNPENFSWMLSPNHSLSIDKPFFLPVDTLRVTSMFQLNRRHPVKRRKYQPHKGIDFGAPSGSPVYPALDGVIVTASRTRSKGKYITIRHNNGYLTTYIHLRRFAPGIKPGKRVELGEKIAEVGRTGYATGAHLHFGVIQDGYYVDPFHLLKSYSYNQKDQQEELNPVIEKESILLDGVSADSEEFDEEINVE